jgi:hypothetical protein
MLFNIFTTCRFHHAKLASDEMAFHASTASLNKSIKKEDILFIHEEEKML